MLRPGELAGRCCGQECPRAEREKRVGATLEPRRGYSSFADRRSSTCANLGNGPDVAADKNVRAPGSA